MTNIDKRQLAAAAAVAAAMVDTIPLCDTRPVIVVVHSLCIRLRLGRRRRGRLDAEKGRRAAGDWENV